MSTLAAILSHIAITGAQVIIAGSGAITNPYIATGVQLSGLLIQGVLANKNSKTDPSGNKLVENPTTNGYISVK